MPETTHYPLSEAATAVRRMGAAGHTGKIVLDVPAHRAQQVVVPPAQVRVFRPDGAYIVTGGLGGLGLFLAEKMAAAGCGRIVLTSRSPAEHAGAGGHRADPRHRRRHRGGVWRHRRAGDGGRLVAAATATGLPVRGVLHAAAVVEDATLTNITDELIERDWAPKVYGAWNLHQATARSRWTGSARSPRQPRWWARRARAPTPRPTAGWTPSFTGARLRAFRPPRSRGEHGPRSAVRPRWRKAPHGDPFR